MSIGPLTTVFIPPLECQNHGIEAASWYSSEDTRYYLTAGPGTRSCFPLGGDVGGGSYYSPGRCPQGYTTACSHLSTYSLVGSTESIATCCPTASGFSFQCVPDTSIWRPDSNWGAFLDCTMLSDGDYLIPATQASSLPSSVLSGLSVDSDNNTFIQSPIINGWGIQIRWQSTDEAVLSTTSPISTTSVEASTTPTPISSTSTPSPTSTTPPTEPAATLSAGAIAGICIGAIVGAIILIGSAWKIFLMKRRQRQQQQALTPPEVQGYTDHGKNEPASDQQAQLFYNQGSQQHLSGVFVAGMPAEQELRGSFPGAGNMAELSATRLSPSPSELQG